MKLKRLFQRFDYTLFGLVIALSLIGILMIHSASASLENHTRYLLMQILAFFIGIVGAFVLSLIPSDFVRKTKVPIGIVGVLLLGIVLVIGVGSSIGTKGWISIGGFSLQPAEIAKVCFIITLSAHVSYVEDRINQPKVLLKLLIHLMIPVGLVMLQPDFGSAMVFVFIFLILLFVAGLSYKYFLGALGSLVVILPLAWLFMKDYQRKRLLVFFNPESDPLGSGYHVIQSKITIGSGQLFGKGYMQGSQTQLGYLPEKQTDFIFAVVGEEFGLIGCLIVVTILILIIARIITIARRTHDTFSEYLCLGVAAMLLIHTIENVGMCIGLMPVTGIPLPFMSYGGSSLITNFLAIGLVLSIRRNASKSVL